MSELTVSWLKGKKGKWKSDGGPRGAGQLVARRVAGGAVLFYYRYSVSKGKEAGTPLGPYDEQGVNGLTLAGAREQVGKLAALYRSGIRDIKGHLEAEAAAKVRAQEAAKLAAERAAEAAQSSTLRQMLEGYVTHMEQHGKQSWKDARSLFTKHVFKAEPELSKTKACDVTVDDFVRVIGRVVKAGKGRTAGKLRSALRAAYSTAIKARHDPRNQAFRVFGVTSNPVSDVSSMSEFNKVRDRHLSAPELGALLRRIDALPPVRHKDQPDRPSAQQDVLRLTLLLGGQRPVQLLRLSPKDVDLDADLITLYDTKGARKQPRVHVLPLVKEAQEILARRIDALADKEPLFSTDGQSDMRIETISGVMKELSEQMVKAKEAREPFQLRDLRRTCETMLASLGVGSDVRAQLQSHGLSGIQQRHYDKYSYALEKKAALEKWARHLDKLKTGEQATVTTLRQEGKGRG